MSARFQAKPADRSWGDRLANKWNFVMPGLPELVEVHVGRLGQTGEQIALTRSLSTRARKAQVGGHIFRVAAPEDRIIISTLQRNVPALLYPSLRHRRQTPSFWTCASLTLPIFAPWVRLRASGRELRRT